MKIIKILPVTSLCMLSLFHSFTNAQNFPPASVNVTTAQIRTLTPLVTVSGTIISKNDSKIASEISGRLIELAPLGARVNEGDIIALIDEKSLKIQKKEHEASVLNAQTLLRFLETEVTRKTALVKQKLSPATELEKIISERDIAKGNVISAQARLEKTLQDLDYTKLKAPFSGIVAQRIAQLGEYIDNGSAIIRLVETANSQAAIFTPIIAYQFLSQSTVLEVESPFGQGTAAIETIIPVADSRSHLMEVRLDMSEFDWPIGLNITAKIASGLSKEALSVPRDALVLRRDGTSVFRINPQQLAEQIPVTLGVSMGDMIEIIGNVNNGDIIVIRGAERLQVGQKVQIKDNNQSLVSGNDAKTSSVIKEH